MADLERNKLIWAAFGRALGAEPRGATVIRGASGLDHEVEAVAVDDKGGRVIIFSAEPSPRVSSLIQVDIQATLPTARVLVARPILFDVAAVAQGIAKHLGWDRLDVVDIAAKIKEVEAKTEGTPDPKAVFGDVFDTIFLASRHVRLPPLTQILAFIQQAALLDWERLFEGMRDQKRVSLPLSSLLTVDSMEIDRRYGICPVPLYELTQTDWDLLLTGTKIDDIEERLRALGIYQYFFPAPDHLALGFTDRAEGRATPDAISSAIDLTQKLGHPLGGTEVINSLGLIPEMIDELKDKGLIVDGEFGLEVTSAGASARATVKFRPRESTITKLLQRLNVNLSVSPKDLLPPH